MVVVKVLFTDYSNVNEAIKEMAMSSEDYEDDYELVDVSAQEVALHTAMCINAEYIRSWGIYEYLSKLFEYVEDKDLERLVKAINTLENGDNQ